MVSFYDIYDSEKKCENMKRQKCNHEMNKFAYNDK